MEVDEQFRRGALSKRNQATNASDRDGNQSDAYFAVNQMNKVALTRCQQGQHNSHSRQPRQVLKQADAFVKNEAIVIWTGPSGRPMSSVLQRDNGWDSKMEIFVNGNRKLSNEPKLNLIQTSTPTRAVGKLEIKNLQIEHNQISLDICSAVVCNFVREV